MFIPKRLISTFAKYLFQREQSLIPRVSMNWNAVATDKLKEAIEEAAYDFARFLINPVADNRTNNINFLSTRSTYFDKTTLLFHDQIMANVNDALLNYKFIGACENRNIELFNLLEPYANIYYRNNEAINLACKNDHVDIVRRLLWKDIMNKCTFVNSNDNYLLHRACINGNNNMIDLLISFDAKPDELAIKYVEENKYLPSTTVTSLRDILFWRKMCS